MYGLPGETRSSMEQTYQYSRKIIDMWNSRLVLLSGPPIPLIGSELFRSLKSNPRVREEYTGDMEGDDSFDYQSLVELHTKHFTYVSYDEVIEYVNKTRALVSKDNISGFGVNIGVQEQ
jgi:hypothetical protein